jgi:phosphate transport system permease protein
MRPAFVLSFAISALMLISSSVAIVVDLDIGIEAIAWEAMLLASAALLIISYTTLENKGRVGRRSLLILAGDIAFLLAVFILHFSGLLGPGFVIEPEGIGAAFGYNLVYPLLILSSGFLVLKDSINLMYGYNQKGREVLVFLLIRLSAVVALLILGGILFMIISKGLGAISWEFLTEPHRSLGQRAGSALLLRAPSG